MRKTFLLQPFLPGDTIALADLFAQSIEELTADDYTEGQRIAWASAAADGEAFAERLGGMVTLVVRAEGEYAGFASLKDNATIDMLYVHPDFAGQGVGSTLVDALEKLAKARGAGSLTVDASDTAEEFFERRGYVPQLRNTVPREDEWLANTTMKKDL
ncbi:MAG: GNAT family N-acetyltransferase [Hyphomicrobiaceae bacterium]|nr:GNAT family N-acetyltransferase [Hyphomicrobiaceae bacterium]